MTRTDRDSLITALYTENAAALQRIVSRKANAPHETIEDACSFAWAQLFTHTDVDLDTAFPWLVVVASRHAWELSRDERRAQSLDAMEGFDAADDAAESLDSILAEKHLRELIEALPERQRAVMTLQATGLRREEMADALGWTLRTVDRQLSRARARLWEQRPR